MPERVDLHCHILPGVDDGAETLSDTRKLLAAERKSGVERFVFTPHFYPAHDAPEAFLARRAEAAAQLRALPEAEGIEFRLGAEIAFFFDTDKAFWTAYGFNALSVGAGEAAVMYALGVPLLLWLLHSRSVGDPLRRI